VNKIILWLITCCKWQNYCYPYGNSYLSSVAAVQTWWTSGTRWTVITLNNTVQSKHTVTNAINCMCDCSFQASQSHHSFLIWKIVAKSDRGHSRLYSIMLFTARRTLVQNVVCYRMSSVCPSVCDVGGSWPHRWKILETNCTNNIDKVHCADIFAIAQLSCLLLLSYFMMKQESYAQTAQTSADPEDPDFGLWTPGSEAWSGSPPKL